ncbi:MAG TPA: HPP family protein [Azospirillaceae bacterium]|nr:HPP family protein [Azospirillaceae bacterium]
MSAADTRPPTAPAFRAILLAGLGAGAAVLLLASLADLAGTTLLMAPFGASCVLAFALPDSPLSQPRSIVGGHLVASAVGLAVAGLLGVAPWTLALAVSLAVALMLATRTTHAPAGADPILVMLSGAGWEFLATPVLAGSLLLVAAAVLYHRVVGRAFPKYWV